MRFPSLTVISVLLITFVFAIPAPDKYIHYKDPSCSAVRSRACLLIPYCANHRKLGDLFTNRGSLKSRGAPEPETLDLNLTDALSPSSPWFPTTRNSDIIWKRTLSSPCGILSCYTDREVSEELSLVVGILYDLIIDYPYDGATGGKIQTFFPLPTSPSNLLNRSPSNFG